VKKMARRLMRDYGIDLGTTNSAIGRVEKGKVEILRSNRREETIPSCVHFSKKGRSMAGKKGMNQFNIEAKNSFFHKKAMFNTFIEFKRTMGSKKKYHSDNAKKSFNSEELSSVVLKELKTHSSDNLRAVVITVPAKFKSNQNEATLKAADLAGFMHCLLVQEPIAAISSYSFGKKIEEGDFIVFDFGGGTFDAALIHMNKDGIAKVIDTEGDNVLGGKNIDEALVEGLLLPRLKQKFSLEETLKSAEGKAFFSRVLKPYAETMKIEMSSSDKIDFYLDPSSSVVDDCGVELELETVFEKKEWEAVMRPIFQKSIDLTKKLLSNNNVSQKDLKKVLLVGGSTLSPLLQEMVKKDIGDKVDNSINPMTAVVEGACIYASTKEIPQGIEEVDESKIQLKLTFPPDTVETTENLGIKIIESNVPESDISKFKIELKNTAGTWSSGMVQPEGLIILMEDIPLNKGKVNDFELCFYDEKGNRVLCEPDSFSILQGSKLARATSSHSIAIGTFSQITKSEVLTSLEGVVKNQELPARGKGSFKTRSDIRPGKSQDVVRIPLYQVEPSDIGKKATHFHNDIVGEIEISGKDFSKLLPQGSKVEVEIVVDESKKITVSARFPYLDGYSKEKAWKDQQRDSESSAHLKKKIKEAYLEIKENKERFSDSDKEKISEIKQNLDQYSHELKQNKSIPSERRDQLSKAINAEFLKIDQMSTNAILPDLILSLKEIIKRMEELFSAEEEGFVEFEKLASDAIDSKDTNAIQHFIVIGQQVIFEQTKREYGPAFYMASIQWMDENFKDIKWKNEIKARSLIDKALDLISENTAKEENLSPIFHDLQGLRVWEHGEKGRDILE